MTCSAEHSQSTHANTIHDCRMGPEQASTRSGEHVIVMNRACRAVSVAPAVGVAVVLNTSSRLLHEHAEKSLSYSAGLPPVHLALRVPHGLLGHWDRHGIYGKPPAAPAGTPYEVRHGPRRLIC